MLNTFKLKLRCLPFLCLCYKKICSSFPAEILAEVEDRDWSSQNQEQGSYQTIIPGIFHMVHPDLVL